MGLGFDFEYADIYYILSIYEHFKDYQSIRRQSTFTDNQIMFREHEFDCLPRKTEHLFNLKHLGRLLYAD